MAALRSPFISLSRIEPGSMRVNRSRIKPVSSVPEVLAKLGSFKYGSPMSRATNGAPALSGLPDGMLSRIRVALASLNPAERRVADIVLAQPGQVVHLVIAEIAALADVSEGTVVRFCNSVGCRGYQALKLALAADLAQPTLVLQEDITPADASDPALVAQKVFASDMLALQDTLKLL